MSIYYEDAADRSVLSGRRIAVLGYGSQGHAHAQNLRDSGLDVVVGLRPGSASWARAEADGLTVVALEEAVRAAAITMVLVPDTQHRTVFAQAIAPGLTAGKTLMFAHGFSVHFGQVTIPDSVDVSMIAPKAPGHVMRDLFLQGIGVPALVAIERDVSQQAKAVALAYASGIGCARAGVVETTFKEETETDLFGEQACICGGVMSLIKTAFETLVEAGYQPDVAYLECLHEMKLIVDLMYQGGLRYMTHSISDTAEYGAYTRGPRLVDERTRSEMRSILAEIRSREFADEWVTEYERGSPTLRLERERTQAHPIEEVGARLRRMMTWIKPPRA